MNRSLLVLALGLSPLLPSSAGAASLEWLNLPATTGMTFQQACQTFPQYRPATEGEVQLLLASFNFPIAESLQVLPDLRPALAQFDNYLGLNMAGAGPAYGFAGTIGDGAGREGYQPVIMAAPRLLATDYEASHVEAAVNYQTLGGWWLVSRDEIAVAARDDVAWRGLGHFMVREVEPQASPLAVAVSPVPEPSVALLLAAGLAGLAVRRRA
jgi:hypothetical protein